MRWAIAHVFRLVGECLSACLWPTANGFRRGGLAGHESGDSPTKPGGGPLCGTPTAKSGQALLEYVLVAAVLCSTIAILALFLYTFKEYGGRIMDLVAYEYP